MTPKPSNGELIALLRRIPPQPLDTHTPLTTLRPLFAGALTFDEALSPHIQAAFDACEALACRDTPGRSVCQRLSDVRPVPATGSVPGW